jgi:hypothetical protein
MIFNVLHKKSKGLQDELAIDLQDVFLLVRAKVGC